MKTATNILRSAFAVFVLACFSFVQNAKALSPAPDGGYPRGNTAEGQNALFSLTTGGFNAGVGFLSLRSNTAGNFNTAIGAGTLLLSTGDENTAIGAAALLSNTTGNSNTASGTQALLSNTSGNFNAANGFEALYHNTTGDNNTASGYGALVANTTGFDNTANGVAALRNNTTGDSNAANGFEALYNNTTGIQNTANGLYALFHNATGVANTASGVQALYFNTGSFNTADGFFALYNNTTGVENTANGVNALYGNSTGNSNTAIGTSAGNGVTTANYVTCIGANVLGANVSNTTWIANVYSVPTQSGATLPVIVSDSGQLGTLASAERFKKDIAAMEKASEAILSLRPVTFHYKTDTKGTPQFGLIAEEVANVNPALVLLDKEGKPYTVRYDQVNAMLLNEFLKEHRKVEELEASVTQQQKNFQSRFAEQEEKIEALTSSLQRVSAQIEVPQTFVNSH